MARIGDEPQRITNLLLIEFAERSLLLHSAVHFVRFGGAGSAAEMTNKTGLAATYILDLPACNQAERRTVQNLFDGLAEQVAAAEGGQADEFAAGEQIAMAARAKKLRPPPQGEMSHMRRRAVGAKIAIRMLAKFATTSLRPVSR